MAALISRNLHMRTGQPQALDACNLLPWPRPIICASVVKWTRDGGAARKGRSSWKNRTRTIMHKLRIPASRRSCEVRRSKDAGQSCEAIDIPPIRSTIRHAKSPSTGHCIRRVGQCAVQTWQVQNCRSARVTMIFGEMRGAMVKHGFSSPELRSHPARL